MRTLIALAVCTCLGWLVGSGGPAAEPADPLAPLAPFVGREWSAAFPDGKLTDTQRFEWMLGKKFVRNPHEVRNELGKVVYEGETVYGWDANDQVLRWWYFNATGGWIDGTLTVEDDGALLFEGKNHAGSEQTAEVRSTSQLDGPDRWISTTWFRRDGDWQVERELVFESKP